MVLCSGHIATPRGKASAFSGGGGRHSLGVDRRRSSLSSKPSYLPPIPGYITGAGSLIIKALDLIPPDSPQAGRLQSALSQVKGLEEGDFESANHAYNVALEIASNTNDSRLESQTLTFAADVDGFHLRWAEALEKGLRLEKLSSPHYIRLD